MIDQRGVRPWDRRCQEFPELFSKWTMATYFTQQVTTLAVDFTIDDVQAEVTKSGVSRRKARTKRSVLSFLWHRYSGFCVGSVYGFVGFVGNLFQTPHQ